MIPYSLIFVIRIWFCGPLVTGHYNSVVKQMLQLAECSGRREHEAGLWCCRGLFQNTFRELIGLSAFDIAASTLTERGNVMLLVTVHTSNGSEVSVTFVLRKKDVGKKSGCWTTLSLLSKES